MKNDKHANDKDKDKDKDKDSLDPATADEASTSDSDQLIKELEQLKELHQQAVAQSQRALADYANLKKRFDKERAEIGTYVIETVVSQLLPALDNLGRAVQHATDDDKKSPLYQGLDMTMQQLDQVFRDIGVNQIKADPGLDFDPNIHEAVDVTAGKKDKIITELSTGYTINDKVIRPARVTVGNGQKLN